jgi:hypothetical protein
LLQPLIKAHFENPEIQTIGSLWARFSYVLLQNGEWPEFDFDDIERVGTFGQGRSLATVLRDTDEKTIELRDVNL